MMKPTRLLVTIVLSVLCIIPALAEQSEAEKRKDVIKYGLESEVIDLVNILGNENDESYTADLLVLFNRTRNPSLRDAVLSLFIKQKNASLKDYCLSLLDDPYAGKKSTVLIAFDYVTKLGIKESLPAIRKILESENTEYREQSIQALGKIGETSDATYLLDYLDGDIPGEEKERLVLRQSVMEALGQLKAVETWDRMAEIVKDEEENAYIRADAAVAIGQMGKEESVEILLKLFENTDPVLRSAAIKGLSYYSTQSATDTIIEGFKDSYYKVRTESIQAVARIKLASALPYILYRAKNDPVENVKMAAYDALGEMGSSEGIDWLNSVFADDKTSEKIRVKACAVLLKNSPDSIMADLVTVCGKVLSDDKKTWIRYELGKLISSTETQSTAGIAISYLGHKDTLTKSIGLDMYAKNRYPEMTSFVEAIAADAKMGALQRRAKKILDTPKTNVSQ
jgi:HEAT repeat protein